MRRRQKGKLQYLPVLQQVPFEQDETMTNGRHGEKLRGRREACQLQEEEE